MSRISWRRFAFFTKEVLAEGSPLRAKLNGNVVGLAYCEVQTRKDDEFCVAPSVPEDKSEEGHVKRADVRGICFVSGDGGSAAVADAVVERVSVVGSARYFVAGFPPIVAAALRLTEETQQAVGVFVATKRDDPEQLFLSVVVVRAIDFFTLPSEVTTVTAEARLRTDHVEATCVATTTTRACVGFADGAFALYDFSVSWQPKLVASGSLSTAGVTNVVFGLTENEVFATTLDQIGCFLFGSGDPVHGEQQQRRTRIVSAIPKVKGDVSPWNPLPCVGVSLEPNRGCNSGCAAYSSKTRELVIARKDGLFFYSNEDRGGAIGFECEKLRIACIGDYIVVASRHAKSRRPEVHAYDVPNKRVVHFHRLAAGHSIVGLSGSPIEVSSNLCDRHDNSHGTKRSGRFQRRSLVTCFVASPSAIGRIDEKPTHEKLRILFRMSLYPTAVEVAVASKATPGDVMDIYRMYGDHLYNKCDWDAAVVQYARTIGRLEPSYVVRRFLDAQRVDHLATYLVNWHQPHTFVSAALSKSKWVEHLRREKDYVLSKHQFIALGVEPSVDDVTYHAQLRPELTKLLVHIYAKLKDLARIDELVNNPRLVFDVKTAVAALREAGLGDHALALANHRDEHRLYALLRLEHGVLAETASEVCLIDAIDHIARLSFVEQAVILKVHAVKLVTAHPRQATELLMRLCVTAAKAREDKWRRHDDSNADSKESIIHGRARAYCADTDCPIASAAEPNSAELFAPAQLSAKKDTRVRTTNDMDEDPACLFDEDGGFSTDFLATEVNDKRDKFSECTSEEDPRLLSTPAIVDVMPNSFIHHFIHQPIYLRVFLDYVRREAQPLSTACAKDIANTLIELAVDEWVAAEETVNSMRAKVEQQDPLLANSGTQSAAQAYHDGMPTHPSALVTPALVTEYDARLAEVSTHAQQKSNDALVLLTDMSALYDRYFALVLVESRGFAAGRLLLFEQVLRRNDTLASEKFDGLEEAKVNIILLKEYAKLYDVKAMLRVCRAQGSVNPGLWLSLIHFVKCAVPHLSRGDFFEKCDDLADILGVVDDERALTAQRCLEVCARNHNVPLDAPKRYIAKLLTSSSSATEKNREAIFDLRQQTSTMRQDLHDLRTAAIRLVSNRDASDAAIKRAGEANPSTTWAAFLLINLEGTDYDTSQRVDDGDTGGKDPAGAAAFTQDPYLGGEHRKWEQIKKSQRATADDHEQFFKELDDPETGGFDCVVRYFGKGVIR
eukprot:CAMPEP_0198650190 /NCGR_PEP_ID=MMETSP1467-20131203/4796_1 /TAXON_ID=1462469 /ORGANISM="unid. sp., Strain CCMP2135" /LENGTH=1236 /DNA_ID=CAMNT_0044386027 /DNA_START=21 /DNA_END=3731 /DNA_ORIENTATION=+